MLYFMVDREPSTFSPSAHRVLSNGKHLIGVLESDYSANFLRMNSYNPVPIMSFVGPFRFKTLSFRSLFTDEEKASIYDKSRTDGLAASFLDELKIAEYIDLEDIRTINGIQYLRSVGVLTSSRANEILTSIPTEDQFYSGK